MNQTPLPSIRIIAVSAALLFSPFLAHAQYTPNPRDYAAHRFLMDDGTGDGFYGIIRLSGTLTSHIYYDFPTNASGSFIFSNSSGGQTITGGLTVDDLTLTTPLEATSGGTGFSSYAIGDML
ncbi:MAG: hypothetical protein JNJ94_06020, partial [Chlorobi bacterium]|nr:hypothetical protein [Chlorobiota bacterium]